MNLILSLRRVLFGRFGLLGLVWLDYVGKFHFVGLIW